MYVYGCQLHRITQQGHGFKTQQAKMEQNKVALISNINPSLKA